MGMSANAVLAYGYDLGGEEWKVREVGEYGALTLPWFNEDDEDDFVTAAKKRLLVAAGFVEDDWQVDGYFARQREAKDRLGVEFETYVSLDYPQYILAAKVITAGWGDSELVDVTALQCEPLENHWDDKLTAALKTLGLTPTQEQPGWLLVSYWG